MAARLKCTIKRGKSRSGWFMRARVTSHRRPGLGTDIFRLFWMRAERARLCLAFARPTSATREIDLVEHFAAVKPAFQKIHEESRFALPQAVAYGAGVRCDEEVWGFPERAFGWERLDGGYVERGAAERAAF